VREKDRDKKGKKSSVFGNLFRKKSRKSSKDEDSGREEDATEPKGTISSDVIIEKEVNEDETSNRKESFPSEKGLKSRTSETAATVDRQGTSEHVATPVLISTELVSAYSSQKLIKSRIHMQRGQYPLQILLWTDTYLQQPRKRVVAWRHLHFHGQTHLFIHS